MNKQKGGPAKLDQNRLNDIRAHHFSFGQDKGSYQTQYDYNYNKNGRIPLR